MVVVSGAVIFIASGLSDDIDHAPTGTAEFRREAIRLHTELLHGVRRRTESDAIEIADRIDGAIEQHLVGGGAATTDRKVGVKDPAAAARIAHLALGHDAGR